MTYNNTCTVCKTHISPEHMYGNTAICPNCGTSNSFRTKKSASLGKYQKPIMYTLILLLGVGGYFFTKSWGKHSIYRAYYSTKSFLRVTSGQNEWYMGKVCRTLKKIHCTQKTLAKAERMLPENARLLGELAVAQTKDKKHVTALKTYSKFFALGEGSFDHLRYYARTLAYTQYTDDAKEQYYKALKMKEARLDVAKELIDMLVTEENFVEALAVIGHYNMYQPQTRKKWAKLATDIKNKYQGYNNQYDVKEMQISGMKKYLFAPVELPGSSNTQIFLVDTESIYLTMDLDQLQASGVEFTTHGATTLEATSGKTVQGTKIKLKKMKVGPFNLSNVDAVACSGCAFLLGKPALRRFSFKKPAPGKLGTQYLTLKK